MVDNKHLPKRFAVVFPGQGSQTVGMLSEINESYPVIQETFQEASYALGFDLWEVCQDEERLGQTKYTQPALLTASMAVWRVLQQQVFCKTGQPSFLAGHSLGEYSALCASGVLTLTDAVKLVYKRGELMQEAVVDQEVMMAAVLGLENRQVINVCEQAQDLDENAIVNAANFNCPGQVVVAGNKVGVQLVMKQVKDNIGKKALPLKVSVPSHCQLMDTAAEKFATVLSSISLENSNIPVIQNRHAKTELTLKAVEESLVEQLNNPVLWTQTMDKMAENQVDLLIECGNGNVLSNLSKRQSKPLICYPTDKIARIEKLIQDLSI